MAERDDYSGIRHKRLVPFLCAGKLKEQLFCLLKESGGRKTAVFRRLC